MRRDLNKKINPSFGLYVLTKTSLLKKKNLAYVQCVYILCVCVCVSVSAQLPNRAFVLLFSCSFLLSLSSLLNKSGHVSC